MEFTTDMTERSVSFELPKKMYSKDAVQIAAHVFDSRARVLLAEEKGSYSLALETKRKTATEDDLKALGGEFVNELLNQEYRFIVGKFNQKISGLIVTQAMFAARGGENPPGPSPEEQTPEFKAEVAKLMKQAADEIKRTMPKKIAPQGTVLPPAPEGING